MGIDIPRDELAFRIAMQCISDRAKLREALEEIRDILVSKRQLPITNQVFEIAEAALNTTKGQEQ